MSLKNSLSIPFSGNLNRENKTPPGLFFCIFVILSSAFILFEASFFTSPPSFSILSAFFNKLKKRSLPSFSRKVCRILIYNKMIL